MLIFLSTVLSKIRSSRPEVFCKNFTKKFLEISQFSQENTCANNLFYRTPLVAASVKRNLGTLKNVDNSFQVFPKMTLSIFCE